MKAYFNLLNIASYKAQQLATSFAKKKKKERKKIQNVPTMCYTLLPKNHPQFSI